MIVEQSCSRCGNDIKENTEHIPYPTGGNFYSCLDVVHA